MTPIPLADPPRVAGLRPDAETKTTDDRQDPEEGVPDAFLVAMGLVPGPAAPQSAPPGTEDRCTPLPRTGGAAASTPAATVSPGEQPAGACGDATAAEAASGSSAPDDPGPASATALSVGEMAFRASNLAAEPSAEGDAGAGGAPGEDLAQASDPAMSGDGGAAAGSDGRAGDPAEQAHRLRVRASGADSAAVPADPAGEDAADQPAKGAAATAPGSGTAQAPAAAAGAKPAFRAATESSAADALSAASGAIADPGIGADPAAGVRMAERPHAATQAAAPLPPGFGHRLAEAVAQFPDRGVELTLSPEELGRVRMMLSTHDGALTLSIQADRPETIDLMRRHIDQLAQDFRDLGFTDVSFSFSRDDTAPGGQEAERETGDPAVAPATDGPVRDAAAPAGAPQGGLDLRL